MPRTPVAEGQRRGKQRLARATFGWFTVLLRDVEPVVSDPLDELTAPDVISSGGEEEGMVRSPSARLSGLSV
jgi:hypothetical protein